MTHIVRSYHMAAILEVSLCSACTNNCAYCPQCLLRSRYDSNIKLMSFENFKMAIDKLPPDSSVSFAGFSEPAMNPYFCDMVLYAHSKGHEISLFSTLVGLKIEQYNKIKDIPFGKLVIHLPDNCGKSKIKITRQYLEMLKYFVDNPPEAECEFTHHVGDLHPYVKDIVPHSHTICISDRAGNLRVDAPNVVKAEQTGKLKCNAFLSVPDGAGVLLPNGDIQVCCQDFGLEHTFGNLFIQSWEEIMNSAERKKFCASLLDEASDCMCRKCIRAESIT